MMAGTDPLLDVDPAIRIVDYDPVWPAMFAAEAAVLRAALGAVAVRIDHVGSTSVPSLAAKPIIDIQISVATLVPMAPYRGPLEALGYLFVEDPEFPDFHFFGKPSTRPRTHHVHVCAAGSVHEHRHLAVRDFLRTHPDVAATYAAIKRALATDSPGNRERYIVGKDAFMQELEQRALAWANA
jgi:GrpB-like predicted nucleotidyltransferase (UPF0157 family)